MLNGVCDVGLFEEHAEEYMIILANFSKFQGAINRLFT